MARKKNPFHFSPEIQAKFAREKLASKIHLAEIEISQAEYDIAHSDNSDGFYTRGLKHAKAKLSKLQKEFEKLS